ncbi:coatomer subunit beta'-like [Schistocerca gregaria]|uniref:coatomer subunit beta'-like n=1 Tax=Schistocerca gregaria TaxID=7010 RepID=UPI00211F07F5|nr:coatomer subunit beta'-like [Schistocerca gregaria]XP_049848922.1 coatomer subunit beta'-like [Schistocerca gregaria]XP_049848923.1 coatomer subunit beta'-like [Schistocerca gregaria]XP_049848924.1 coatomer subunit beta'-like [Schistocerca gregaria]XP_049848925.1 coatomer subunit beta'-like [Schistocerca gregaria]
MLLDISKKFFANSARVKCVDIHPTDPWIVSSLYNGSILIYNYRTQTLFKQIDATDCPIRSVKFVARKQWVVSASDDKFIRVHSIDTSQCLEKWEAHAQYIRCVVIHPTQPLILSGSDDNTIKLWNWKRKFSLVRTFEAHSHYVMGLAINPRDPNLFASVSLDCTVKIWNVNASAPNFSLEGHEDGINCVDYYLGGDKPYLVTGSDDRTVKVWDYQTKTCVQTLEGHTGNVTCVAFHPKLFLIFSGSEDGTVKFWNSNTFRLEKTINYGWERAWSVSCSRDRNMLALGLDRGVILLKLAKELQNISMDSTGKVIYTEQNGLYGCNLQQVLTGEVEDGALLEVGARELGTCDFYPHYVRHSFNGHLVVVADDKEYVIYTALQMRSKSFGAANEFAWNRAGGFATRQGSIVTVHAKNLEVSGTLQLDYTGDCLFSGSLLGVRGSAFVCMYDWATLRLVSKVDVVPRDIVWNEVGDHLVITTARSFYVLRYRPECESAGDGSEEDVFDVLVEISEVVRSACWVGDCLIYINSQNILCHCVGKQTDSIAYLDGTMYLLGYLSRFGRIVLADKNWNFITYSLSLSVINFQTAMLRNDVEGARRLIPSVPENERHRVALFLESRGHPEWAMQLTSDEDHKFCLALKLQELDLARDICLKSDSRQKWQELSRAALKAFKFDLAEEFMWRSKDYSFLLTLFCASGDAKKLARLAEEAREEGQMNVACICYMLLGEVGECIDMLANCGKAAEAILMARSYVPSKVPELLSRWKAELSQVDPKWANCLASPEQYPNLFPGFSEDLASEKERRSGLKHVDLPASEFVRLSSGKPQPTEPNADESTHDCSVQPEPAAGPHKEGGDALAGPTNKNQLTSSNAAESGGDSFEPRPLDASSNVSPSHLARSAPPLADTPPPSAAQTAPRPPRVSRELLRHTRVERP